jgi:uncharacterized protein (TIGR00730 family)
MNITVYCGASDGNDPIYREATIALAKWLVENDHTLVYGGGRVGLMGLIADTVLAEGGRVIGVMPDFLVKREIAHTGLTDLRIVSTMTERKNQMIELGDAYIALPGGPGTLEEITEVISWARIGENSNPCLFLNINDYYNPMIDMFDTMVKNGFLKPMYREKTFFANTIAEAEDFIVNYTPPAVRTY